MKQAPIFWDVDTQVDFMHPGGKLYVPGAEKLAPNLRRLTEWAAQHGILVVASMDAHREGDDEFQEYPPHCLVGTPGQQKIPETVLPRQYVIPNRSVALQPKLADFQQVIVEKQRFDVFTNPNLDALLAQLGARREIVLYGVVTEICVHHAARGLLERGFQVRLVRDAIHHLDQIKGRITLALVEERGGQLVTTDQVVGGQRPE
ncbi:MAG: cysteine hydrolase family protein [Candidatus Acidiferrales bacterium]